MTDEDGAMTEEDYEDAVEDETEERIERENEVRSELTEEEAEAYGVPAEDEKFEMIKFLSEVRDSEDTLKTSYLTKNELGTPLFSVRFWKNLEILAKMHEYKILGAYLSDKAITTTHTGLSREGFLVNSLITRKKEMRKSKIKPPQEVNQNVKR